MHRFVYHEAAIRPLKAIYTVHSASLRAPARTVTVTPSTGACLTSDLRLAVGTPNGATGTIYYPIDFTNVSSSACTLYGYPGVSFVTAPQIRTTT